MTTQEGEPLLSSEETDALLHAMKGSSKRPSIDTVRLGAADQKLREALAEVDRIAPDLARTLSTVFLRITGTALTVKSEPSDVRILAPYRSSLIASTAIATFAGPQGGLGILSLEPPLATFALDCRLGAGVVRESEQTTTLSKVDRRLLRPLMSDWVGALSAHLWTSAEELSFDSILQRPEDLATLNAETPILCLVFRAENDGKLLGEIQFALTPESLRGRASTSARKSDDQPTKGHSEVLLSRVPEIEVDVAAVLGRAPSTIIKLLALNVGDVIRLDSVPGAPISICVGGARVLRGMPVMFHGNLAVEVSESL